MWRLDQVEAAASVAMEAFCPEALSVDDTAVRYTNSMFQQYWLATNGAQSSFYF